MTNDDYDELVTRVRASAMSPPLSQVKPSYRTVPRHTHPPASQVRQLRRWVELLRASAFPA